MRILHVVKTSDGADWAAAQAAELVKLGVEIHVALPRSQGRVVEKWVRSGAVVHTAPTDLPIRAPWTIKTVRDRIRKLVTTVRPHLIHSHFFGSTLLFRLSLGRYHRTPRIFQVPGPLHLEHRLWRMMELSTAGPSDHWIASSHCILRHYQQAGVPSRRLYLSYYGIPTDACGAVRSGMLRRKFNIPDDLKVVGNANFMYPPKWYLGHRIGLKAHEDIIDALSSVINQRQDVCGVLIGGAPPHAGWYERSLRRRAQGTARGRILMTGYLPVDEIRQMWADFDVAVHVPLSENCGGIGEPMLAGVPVIAGDIGGLPELIVPGVTGTIVPIRRPQELAAAINRVLDSHTHYLDLAKTARALALRMAADEHLASEIVRIYSHVLGAPGGHPMGFDPARFLSERCHVS